MKTMDVETFPNAPIKEALIDIRVNLPKTVTEETLASLHQRVRDSYPQKKERRIWKGAIELPPDKQGFLKSTDQSVDGYFFLTEDGKHIVQYRKDGFTYNFLRPYTNWEDMRNEASRLWGFYLESTHPTLITRIALRYINIVEIPSMMFNLNEYFTAPPSIPPNLPQTIENYSMTYTLKFPTENAKSLVTLSTPGTSYPDKTQIYFDIDVFREFEFLPPFENLWDKFENLRDIKNSIFFDSITENTKKLFR